MIETFRAIGYGIESAVADIVDNSISANARNIWVSFEWRGSASCLTIVDDGVGMNNEELVQALRPGSRNPLEERGIKDLGRFGLGLKTASFSQCRQLTVVSKKENFNHVHWTWDLDFVRDTGKWDLIKYPLPEEAIPIIQGMSSGTIILWNELDRLVSNTNEHDAKALDKFLGVMEQVKSHLSMTFHRFIQAGKISIFFQDRIIPAWDPFLQSEIATQAFPSESLNNGKISIKGYVLPHKSKISEDRYKEAEGPKGWNHQQGFYVYRNDRLLVSGEWLGMFRKEEHYKLARIEINLPNSMDTEWQIDIKKSEARPPFYLRDQLRAYAGRVRAQAVEVYRQRGKSIRQLPGQKFVPLWTDHKRGDKWFYKINREHPLIERTKTLVLNDPEKSIEVLLRFIEETIPTKSIYIKESEDPETQGKPFEELDQEVIRSSMKQIVASLKVQGKSDEQAKAIVVNIEPFNHFTHFLEFI